MTGSATLDALIAVSSILAVLLLSLVAERHFDDFN